jgi:hypothetical protein
MSRRLLQAALHALRSYQHGNTSTELAEDIANQIQAELGAGSPTDRPENWDQHAAIADVLREHMPAADPVTRLIRCGCGWEAHFIDAKAWHRHAAAMVATNSGLCSHRFGEAKHRGALAALGGAQYHHPDDPERGNARASEPRTGSRGTSDWEYRCAPCTDRHSRGQSTCDREHGSPLATGACLCGHTTGHPKRGIARSTDSHC